MINLTFRDLDEKDIPGIKEISKGIYDGIDYLGPQIKDWLLNPDVFIFGCFWNDELVALKVRRMLDEGETVWGEAVRVSKSFRGLGLRTMLDTMTDKCLFKIPTTAKRIRWAVAVPPEIYLPKASQKNITRDNMILECENALLQISQVEEFLKKSPLIKEYQVQEMTNAKEIFHHLKGINNDYLLQTLRLHDMTVENVQMFLDGYFDLKPKRFFSDGPKKVSYNFDALREVGLIYNVYLDAPEFKDILPMLHFHMKCATKEPHKYAVFWIETPMRMSHEFKTFIESSFTNVNWLGAYFFEVGEEGLQYFEHPKGSK